MIASIDHQFEFVSSDHRDWDAYVRQHPKGSIFHTAPMLEAFAAMRGFKPYARAAIDANGTIVALLSSCHVKTLNQLASISSRAVQFAEPLCDPDPVGIAALSQLITKHDQHMRSRALLGEVRSICEPGFEKYPLLQCGYEHREYINYVVNVDQDRDALWKLVHKRERQKIRSSYRKGVTVRDDNSPEGIERLYGLLRASYARARVPLAPCELFHNTLKHLAADHVRVRTAFKDNRPVASVISLLFGGRMYSWYGGTMRPRGLSPFACIVWEDIAWASEHGFAFYDFGGAGWPEENYGPREFKARFGGTEVRYGRYMKPYSKMRLRLAEIAYQCSRWAGMWSSPKHLRHSDPES